MATHLQKIIAEAKKIRKAHPNKKWTDCVKAASKKIKPVKKVIAKKSVAGYVKTIRKGSATNVLYSNTIKKTKEKPVQKTLFGTKGKMLGEFFDKTAIKDLDSLKKQYFKLAKKYHPDSGGTTIQFQELQKEYEKLLKSILNGSNFTTEQKKNEIELDEAMRIIIDSLVNIEGLNIELIGKWLWISGNTYSVRTILKSCGMIFIKKDGKPFWVYKGVESAGRGKTPIDEIRAKYGTHKVEVPKLKKLSGIPLTAKQKTKLKLGLKKAINALNKRPV
jgi:hypothetical protein